MKNKRSKLIQPLLSCVAWLVAVAAMAQTPREMENGFRSPPPAARPWVYYFPSNGNLTKEGITADLEAMARVGIGGLLYMEVAQGVPNGQADFAGPLWRELVQHACKEARRFGLEINMNNDAGWCGSGGPWITPELSMQRIVWTETNVTGPQHFEADLAQPTAVRNFYQDIAVFAFPTPAIDYTIAKRPGKTGEGTQEIPLRATYPVLPADSTIAKDRIVMLTGESCKNGRVNWNVPAGKWTLLRIGHTTTGKDNHPAPIDGRGLECDKLSKEAAEVAFNGLMGKVIADSRPLVGEAKTMVSTHIDSWEVGSQNWTPKFREEFQQRRGYDPLPLFPVMVGHVVDSLEVSERFLWDVRMTISDLVVENYAGRFQELARQHGIRLSIEAYGEPADDLTYAGRADEPMSEFWSWDKFGAAFSCTEMASAAHVYGKRILGAEAFTASDSERWQGHPAYIKDLGDWAFCEGVNRFVFHRYALQPWTNPERPPGVSMGPWGLHYERTQTWWEQSRPWHEYLARCQFLLQQGLFVADLCFLAPERSPQAFKSPVKSGYDRPGYNFDGCPPEVVLTRMSVKDGRLVLPDGMSYRLLVLPQVETMTPKLLRKIKELVAAGATVVGAPPVKSPSLTGYPQCDDEVKALAAELWGTGEPPAQLTARSFGKGRIYWGGE
ncbi:MAG: glycosyl hydrolase, partial [Verrucomicrobiota bacterium]